MHNHHHRLWIPSTLGIHVTSLPRNPIYKRDLPTRRGAEKRRRTLAVERDARRDVRQYGRDIGCVDVTEEGREGGAWRREFSVVDCGLDCAPEALEESG